MENQSYYRVLSGQECNEAIPDRYFAVNCTGCCVLKTPFTSHRPFGRRDYYLLYLYDGIMRILVNGEMREMKPGEMIIIDPGSEYKYTKAGPDDIVYYWAHFTGYGTEGLLKSLSLESGKIIDTGRYEQVVRSFHGIFSEFIRHDYCFEEAAAAQLISVFTMLSRNIKSADKNIASADSDRIYSSLKFIYKNYNTALTLSQLADIEHLSVSRYRTIFKRCTGFSPQDYIITLRIQRACELIAQSDMTVKEIAESVGYQDQLYFSRIFKSRMGIVPNRYKEYIPGSAMNSAAAN